MTTTQTLIGIVVILGLVVIAMAWALWKQQAKHNEYFQAWHQKKLLDLDFSRLCYALILIFSKEDAERPIAEFPQWCREYLKAYGGIDSVLAAVGRGNPPGMDRIPLDQRKLVRDAIRNATPAT